MLICGWQKLSLIDFPKKIATTLFTGGCNFFCPWCHNRELVEPKELKKQSCFSEEEIFDFLKERIGLLDGVCLTGGEPTLQPDLIDFISKIKKMGYVVKLDTNGSQPQVLRELFQKKLLDYVAMDIKCSLEKYPQIIKSSFAPEDLKFRIQESIDLIRKSDVAYEFRLTVVPDIIDQTEVERIGEWLNGSRFLALQQFQNQKTLDKIYQKKKPYSLEVLKTFQWILKKYFQQVELRG